MCLRKKYKLFLLVRNNQLFNKQHYIVKLDKHHIDVLGKDTNNFIIIHFIFRGKTGWYQQNIVTFCFLTVILTAVLLSNINGGSFSCRRIKARIFYMESIFDG